MSMTRAEYEALASAINESHIVQGVTREDAITMTLEIASALCATNDRFDPVRFIDQTGLGITQDAVKDYSHALFLRAGTGIGAFRSKYQ